MAKFNFKLLQPKKAANLAGGDAFVQQPKMQLASLLLTSFAQDQFYRSEKQTFSDLKKLIAQVDPQFAAKAGIYARNKYGMRSITHILAADLAQRASGTPWGKSFYNHIVKRPDDMLEIMALYMGQGNKSLPNALKKGFAQAFDRFDGYQLSKYRGENREVKLVDVVNLVRPVPTDRNAEALKSLINGTLKATGTWESKLTKAGQIAENDAHKDALKAEAWASLLNNDKLGYLALLRNIRNIAEQADKNTIRKAASRLTDRQRIKQSLVMPFQFLSAMDAIQKSDLKDKRAWMETLERATELAMDNVPRFEGRTLVVMDDSGSMSSCHTKYANRSALQLGALFAAALFKANDADLMRFSDDATYLHENSRDSLQGIAGRLIHNARAAGTDFNAIFRKANKSYDRIIILSDMQGWMGGGAPVAAFHAYKKRYKANPYIYSFDLQGYSTLMFPEDKVFCLAGFSDKVFDLMKLLETDRRALIHDIEKVAL